MADRQKITPNLWYDHEAEEAARLYTSVFTNSKVGDVARYPEASVAVSGKPKGSVMTVAFEIAGQEFLALNGGPPFKFTPAVSFLVACETEHEVDDIWKELSRGGTALMDLGAYPFSGRYGWTTDRYGLSWQVMFMGDRRVKQKITPTLMYTGEQAGKAETAIRYYTSVFRDAAAGGIDRYGKNEKPDREGTVRHADFTLEGQGFAAMDSALAHAFTFNEATSFIIDCADQKEIDYYWEKLTAGGQESVCGWLKDRFGVSWQVTPTILRKMMRDSDQQKVERVTAAFLKMKKLDIGQLERAYQGGREAAPIRDYP